MLRVVAETLRRRGTQGWLVGGTVRDGQLGRFSPDLDVVVADDPRQVAIEVASCLQWPWFALSKHFNAYRVVGDVGYVDIAALRGRDLRADLELRDFTVNAMAMPVEGGPLVDPFGGTGHLRERILVAVSDRVFADDPLRLMRAVRFCHVLGFRLDPELDRLLREQAGSLALTARERVLTEMSLTLEAGRSAGAVGLWRDLGLLEVMLPELASGTVSPSGTASASGTVSISGTVSGSGGSPATRPVMAASPATGDAGRQPVRPVIETAIRVLEELDSILADIGAWFPAQAALLAERLAQPVDGALSRPVVIRLTGLLRLLPSQRSEAIGRRLRLPNSVTGIVRRAAEQRESDSGIEAGSLTERGVVSFLWQSAPWEPELILVALGAGLGENKNSAENLRAHAQRLMERWAARVSGVPRPPVDGDDLARELGVEPGPLLGSVAREVQLAWEAGEFGDADEALHLAREFLLESRSGAISTGS